MRPRRRGLRLPTIRTIFRRPLAPAPPLATPQAGGVAAAATPELPPSRWRESLRAFRHRNYRLFYTGQGISLIGTWMQTMAMGLFVLDLTDSKVALGTVTLLQFLPITLFVLFAGLIADRLPKRNILIFSQLIAMSQAAILAGLVITDAVELWHVYILALVLGVANAIDLPTRQSFAIEMVGRKDLVNAVALNSGMFNGGRLIGPAIGGFLYAGAGPEAVFLFNAVSFVPVIASLLMIRTSELFKMEKMASDVNPLRQLREGISYALRTPATRLIIILVALIGTFGYNFTVVLPLTQRYILHVGPEELGFLTAAVGLGAFVAAISLAGRKAATRTQLFMGGAAFAVFLAGIAISENLYITLFLLMCLGAAGATFGTTANTLIQVATPDHLRGRVTSLYMLLFAGSTPLGGFLTGYVAEHVGTREAIGMLAGMCFVGLSLGAAYYVSNRSGVQRTADASRRPVEVIA